MRSRSKSGLKHWLARALGAFFTFVLILGVVLLALLEVRFEIDATPHKDRLAALFQAQTGLNVRAGGEIHLVTGPEAGLRVGELRVSNPGLPDEQPILTAGQLELRVDTRALIGGTLKLLLVGISDGVLALVRDADGRGNWQAAGGENRLSGSRHLDLAALPGDGLVVRIEDSRFDYSDQKAGTKVRIALAQALAEPAGERLKLALDGTLNGQPVRLSGWTTTLSRLAVADAAVPVALSGDLAGVSVEAGGSLAPRGSGERTVLNLDIRGDSLAGLSPLLGDAVALDQPVRGSLRFDGADGAYRIEALDLSLGEQRVSARGDLAWTSQRALEITGAEVELGEGGGKQPLALAIESARLGADRDRIDFDADIRLLGLSVSARGGIEYRKKPALLGARVELSGRSLERLAPWIGAEASRLGPLSARFELATDGEVHELSRARVILAETRFDGRVTLDSTAGEDHPAFDLAGNLLGFEVAAKGAISRDGEGPRLAAGVDVSAPTLAGLQPWIGARPSGLGPVSARFDVAAHGAILRFAKIRLAIAGQRLNADVVLERSGARPALELDLATEHLDLGALAGKESLAQSSLGDQRRGSKQLFSAAPFKLDWMDKLDLNGRLRAGELVSGPLRWSDAEIQVRQSAGRLLLDVSGKALSGRPITASLDLDARRNPPSAQLRLDGDKLRIAPLVAATPAAGMIDGELDLAIALSGSGESPHALVRALGGRVVLLVEGAETDLADLERLTPGLRDLFGLLARRDAADARINCAVAALDVSGGHSDLSAVIDSRDSLVVAGGTLDLDAETLAVRVVPEPKGVNLRVSVPIRISGSLASPRVEVQTAGVLGSLAERLSRVAVPHLLIVDALGEAVAGNPCVRIASGRDQPVGRSGPAAIVTRPVEATVRGAGSVVEGAGRVVKGVGGSVVNGVGGVLRGVGGVLGGGRGREDVRSEEIPSTDELSGKH